MKNIIIIVLTVILVSSVFLVIYDQSQKHKPSDKVKTTQVARNEVLIKDNQFSPYEMIVKKGTSVLFINNDQVDHTITADNGSFDSGQMTPSQTYRRKFNDTGVIQYHCTNHPDMIGQIIVRTQP